MFHKLSRLLNTLVMAITHRSDWKNPNIHAKGFRPRMTKSTRRVSSDISETRMAKMMNGRTAAGMLNNDNIAFSYSSVGKGRSGMCRSRKLISTWITSERRRTSGSIRCEMSMWMGIPVVERSQTNIMSIYPENTCSMAESYHASRAPDSAALDVLYGRRPRADSMGSPVVAPGVISRFPRRRRGPSHAVCQVRAGRRA